MEAHIDLEGMGIGDRGCIELVRKVKAMCGEEEPGGADCPIISINLKHNGIGDEGATYLAELMGYPILFYLSYNNLTNEGSDLLFGAILERQKRGLPHADFYCGFNPGIKYGTWWEALFGGSVKQKSG
jgi:hypothetical protein